MGMIAVSIGIMWARVIYIYEGGLNRHWLWNWGLGYKELLLAVDLNLLQLRWDGLSDLLGLLFFIYLECEQVVRKSQLELGSSLSLLDDNFLWLWVFLVCVSGDLDEIFQFLNFLWLYQCYIITITRKEPLLPLTRWATYHIYEKQLLIINII